LNKLISENIANNNQVLSSSKFHQISKSDIGELGNIGNTAPEKTKSCKAASHSLWFNASAKLSILSLKVFVQVNTIVKIIAIASCQKPIKTQIQNTINAHNSAVIQGLFNLKLPEA
jgi:hypothetical protein